MSQVTSRNFNLESVDIYSQDTLQSLQEERFASGLDYYICVINENDYEFLFDASNFFEQCIRDHKIISNPLSNREVSDLQVFVASQSHPEFKLALTQEELIKHPNHLPIYWNDPSFPLAERLQFMVNYARHYRPLDPDKAIPIYEIAAEEGSLPACLDLVMHYMKIKDRENSIKYLKACIEHVDISPQNLRICAKKFIQLEEKEFAFKAYSLAAHKGDSDSIRAIIQLLESGMIAETGQDTLACWKSKLPKE
ncbi:MAG: sel1 repeat family protein [Chlamydiia bacterium]|nr:sel1 repeat family protein [Chlamydiia bacterium]